MADIVQVSTKISLTEETQPTDELANVGEYTTSELYAYLKAKVVTQGPQLPKSRVSFPYESIKVMH